MRKRPLFIFDLDGTLALIDHRRPLLKERKKEDWLNFYEACDKDSPFQSIITILRLLESYGAEIRIWSGRGSEVRDKTILWIQKHITHSTHDHNFHIITQVLMRPIGSTISDEELKSGWYNELSYEDKNRLVAIFDDRQKMVDMWRSMGLTCLQVAPGNH